MSEDNLTRMNVKIDKTLKQNFKIVALKNKETMTDIVIKAIEKYVEDNQELLN